MMHFKETCGMNWSIDATRRIGDWKEEGAK